jgi:hypothetical protein
VRLVKRAILPACAFAAGLAVGVLYSPEPEPEDWESRFIADRQAEGCTWLYYRRDSGEYMGCGIHLTLVDSVRSEYIGDR